MLRCLMDACRGLLGNCAIPWVNWMHSPEDHIDVLPSAQGNGKGVLRLHGSVVAPIFPPHPWLRLPAGLALVEEGHHVGLAFRILTPNVLGSVMDELLY